FHGGARRHANRHDPQGKHGLELHRGRAASIPRRPLFRSGGSSRRRGTRMARLAAIVRALWLAYRRDWTAFQSLAGNNFFLATVFFMGKAGAFIYVILGLVVLFPLSTDPLRKIPRARLALWPLEAWEHRALRVVSPWLNPLTWVIAGLAIWTVRRNMTFGLWGLMAGIFAGGF